MHSRCCREAEAIGACKRRDTVSKVLALVDYCYSPAERQALRPSASLRSFGGLQWLAIVGLQIGRFHEGASVFLRTSLGTSAMSAMPPACR